MELAIISEIKLVDLFGCTEHHTCSANKLRNYGFNLVLNLWLKNPIEAILQI